MDDTMNTDTMEDNVHPPVLENDNPLSGIFYSVTGFIEGYGWILLFGLVVLMFLKSKLSPAVNKYKRQLEETIESKKFDSSKAQSRLEGMEAARRRMQEQLDAQAARHAEQMKKKEEEKRQQKIEDWEGHLEGKGYRSKHKVNEQAESTSSKLNKEKKSKPLRQADYNPLGGGSDTCTWRPGQRRGAGGG